jgi:hypothetical protein
VLDTNILHNDGIHSIKIKKLKKLIDVNFITLYIPEIVKREYITKMYDKLELELNNATLKENRRYFEYDTHDTKNKIALIDKTIIELKNNIKISINNEFDNWIDEYKIKILLFNNSNMPKVMDEYFTGGSVFSSIKSRKDIPDAMINSCITDLNNIIDDEELYVLVNDAIFKKHLEQQKGIIPCESLNKLLEIEIFEKELSLNNDEITKKLINRIKSDSFKDELISLFSTNSLMNELYVDSDNVLNIRALANNTFFCEVNGLKGDEFLDIKLHNVNEIDNFQFSVDLEFISEAQIRFGTEFIDYNILESSIERKLEFDNMKSDGAIIYYEDRYLHFDGSIILNYNSANESFSFIEIEIYEAKILDQESKAIKALNLSNILNYRKHIK